MNIYRLKAQFQTIALLFSTSGLTANMASLLGWVFSGLTAICFYFGTLSLISDSTLQSCLLLTPIMILLRLIFNALDGLIARQKNQASPMGEVFNEIGDVWGDTLSYGVFFFIPGVSQFSVLVYIILIWFAEFCSILGRALPGQIRRHEAILGGKPERALFFSILSLNLYFNPSTVVYLNSLFNLMSLFVFITALYRIYKIKLETAGKPYQSNTIYGK